MTHVSHIRLIPVKNSLPTYEQINTNATTAPDAQESRTADPVDRAVRLLFYALDAEAEGRHGAVASAQFKFIAITEANGPLFGRRFMPRAARALMERRLPGLPFEVCEAMLRHAALVPG
jgi:hypothetical protein